VNFNISRATCPSCGHKPLIKTEPETILQTPNQKEGTVSNMIRDYLQTSWAPEPVFSNTHNTIPSKHHQTPKKNHRKGSDGKGKGVTYKKIELYPNQPPNRIGQQTTSQLFNTPLL
jgi:hypothetical protein